MKKVLVVDDTKNIKLLLTTCLEFTGYEVLTASNGTEALDLLKNEGVDLIFLDIKMPEISGTEVLRRIRAIGIETPVIVMTAFGTVKNAVECTKLGAIAYLQKPFTAEKVRHVLNEVEPQLESDAISTDKYIKKAKELLKIGELQETFNILKKALSTNVNNGEVYELLARIYELRGDLKEAERFYNISRQFK
ncbi:response regulator [Clostridium sp. CX1]|uniref:Stage 0 sporulation protein A homolog n=1 Tax=Clostridium tanneri TaxID=3037988 RepID=A0ABU4JVE6_9CLOT|nr:MULTISPECIES: response regulator [unclassified Clostridium]MCT8975237.1 response regulator [Clostridium sp. CX1]MDW8802125.1 response regulator [Clostridium sp. A1-XYC3]